ncbi:MAG: undecaprenyl-diphosphate phosphatase, partial [Acetatifactor sp.]|nr:undecaprenyl-diphosphate phosphatase [Acetatifactor sp.]
MFEIIKAIIYGIVEGVTEWLPISSTGHLILVEELIPFQGVSEDFFSMFDVVIQLGAILAVVVLFWNQIWPFALTRKEREGKSGPLSFVKMDVMTLWFKILVSCVPAAVIGVLFDDVLDALFYNPVCVALALIIFGVAFIVIENWNKGRSPKVNALAGLTYQMALLI